jgi:phospholipid-translocating ATPase
MFQDRSEAEAPSGPESPKASSKVNVRRRNSGAGRSAPLANRIKDVAADVYQKIVVELIPRRKNVTVSTEGRRIPLELEHETPLIDPRRGFPYVSNSIRTSRYTVWDFIPKQLFFQFSRVGNFYFLCVGIPQMVRMSRILKSDLLLTVTPDSRPFDHRILHYYSTAFILCDVDNCERRLRRLPTVSPG